MSTHPKTMLHRAIKAQEKRIEKHNQKAAEQLAVLEAELNGLKLALGSLEPEPAPLLECAV